MTEHYDRPDDVAGTVFDPTDDTFGPILAAIQAGDFETAAHRLATIAPPHARHDDGRTDMDDVLSLWLDGAPVIVSTYNPNGRSVLDTADKIDTATLPRVELLHALYTTDLGGGPVTDSDTFAVDAIADVLIWAAHRNGWTQSYGDVQDLAARAVAHALGDLTDAREARS